MPCLRAAAAAAPCRQQLHQVRGISKTVFLKGLPEAVTEEALLQFFREYGEITSTKMLFLDKKIRSHNALITFANYNSAFSVVDELHHSTLFGRRIVAEFSRFKAPPTNNTRRAYFASPHANSSSSPSSSASSQSTASVTTAAAAVNAQDVSHTSNNQHNEGNSSSSNEQEASGEPKMQTNLVKDAEAVAKVEEVVNVQGRQA